MRLNSSFLWLSRCLFGSKIRLVCKEQPKTGRTFTHDYLAFIAIYTFAQGTYEVISYSCNLKRIVRLRLEERELRILP